MEHTLSPKDLVIRRIVGFVIITLALGIKEFLIPDGLETIEQLILLLGTMSNIFIGMNMFWGAKNKYFVLPTLIGTLLNIGAVSIYAIATRNQNSPFDAMITAITGTAFITLVIADLVELHNFMTDRYRDLEKSSLETYLAIAPFVVPVMVGFHNDHGIAMFLTFLCISIFSMDDIKKEKPYIPALVVMVGYLAIILIRLIASDDFYLDLTQVASVAYVIVWYVAMRYILRYFERKDNMLRQLDDEIVELREQAAQEF
jgi:hypothetical protein